jgi:hypothetical protein
MDRICCIVEHLYIFAVKKIVAYKGSFEELYNSLPLERIL